MKKHFLIIFILLSVAGVAYAQDAPGSLSPSEVNALQPTGNTGSNEVPADQTTFGNDYGQTYETQYSTNPEYQPSSQPSSGSGNFVPLTSVPGLTQGATADTEGLAKFFNNLYKFLIGIAAVLAIIEIIWGGLEIMSQDSIAKNKDGKERIKMAILGLVLVLSPFLVFSMINPQILNLSIGVAPLDTKSNTSSFAGGGTGGTGSGTQPTTSSTAGSCPTGCTCTGTLLKKTSCSTQQAAQDYSIACNGKVSSSLFSSTYTATCETTSGSITGPYTFIDTSQATGLIGWFNTLTGYSYYQPLASNPTNQNNGAQVLQFASTCKADGGTTCMSAVKTPVPIAACTYGTRTTATVSYCWAIELYCTDGKSGAGGCSSNPDFKVVN